MSEDKKKKKQYYSDKTGIKSYKKNPWASELAHTIKKGKRITGFAAKRLGLVDKATGEVSGDMAVVGVQKVVDKEEFVKFFSNGIMELFELSKSGRELFNVILTSYLESKNQPDQIYINLESVVEMGYKRSKSTYLSGLNDICKQGFIAPVEGKVNLFWINPNMFYKGNRLRIVKDIVVSGSEEHKQVEAEQAAIKQQQLQLEDE